MKKRIIMFFCALSLIFTLSYADENQKNKEEEKEKFPPQTFVIDGKKYEAYVLWVDMNDMKNYVDISLAKDKVGARESLKSIADRAEKSDPHSKVVGTINGTFFNMATGETVNTVIKNGEIKFISAWASLATFNGENEMYISRPGFDIFGSVNDQWDWPYGFESRSINRIHPKSGMISILDSSYYGKIPDKKMYVLEVKNNIVENIYDRVPSKINNDTKLIVSHDKISDKEIKVGDRIDYAYKAYDTSDKETMSFYNVRTAIGAGPTLVNEGKICIDLNREGLRDWSIYGNRQRSMVGMTKDKKLAFVTSKSISLDALSKLAVQLKMETALNLDGGGSAGLVVDGEYVQKPLRPVSNALVIKRRDEEPIRIVINQIERFYDTAPYLYSGRTMLPLRGILENLGCRLEWKEDTREVIVKRFKSNFIFKENSKFVRSGDKTYEMDVPLLIRDGRSAISVRFLTEFLGGKVKWVEDKRIVDIKIDTSKELYEFAKALYDNEKYVEALSQFEKTLSLNPEHISALKYLAKIYEDYIDDPRTAATYYEKVAELYEEEELYLALARTYLKSENIPKLIELMNKVDEKKYSNIDFFYYKGKAFEHNDIDRAYKNFNEYLKLTQGKNVDYKKQSESYDFINKVDN